MTRGIMLVMASHYSRELAHKTRLGLVKTHESHRFVGGPTPYGFKVVEQDGKRLAIHEEEAATIRLIFDLYLGAEPMGLKAIAQALNDRGIPTRSMLTPRTNKVGLVRNRPTSVNPRSA